jgi:hypothetical protein
VFLFFIFYVFLFLLVVFGIFRIHQTIVSANRLQSHFQFFDDLCFAFFFFCEMHVMVRQHVQTTQKDIQSNVKKTQPVKHQDIVGNVFFNVV